MKRLTWLILSVQLFISAGCMTVKVGSNQFVPRDPGHISKLKTLAPEYKIENVELKQADGAISRGVFVHKDNADFTILYLMGSGVRVDASGSYFSQPFTQLNANILTFDYRGFGRSEVNDQAIELTSLERDTLAIYDYARRLVKGKLIVHGHSFGSFVAARLAQFRPLDGVVLEGTGTNAVTYTQNLTPWYAKPFLRFELDKDLIDIDNRISLNRSKAPVLIINGSDDKITPSATAKDLFDSIQSPKKRFALIMQAGHMNSMTMPDALQAYREFIAARYD